MQDKHGKLQIHRLIHDNHSWGKWGFHAYEMSAGIVHTEWTRNALGIWTSCLVNTRVRDDRCQRAPIMCLSYTFGGANTSSISADGVDQ